MKEPSPDEASVAVSVSSSAAGTPIQPPSAARVLPAAFVTAASMLGTNANPNANIAAAMPTSNAAASAEQHHSSTAAAAAAAAPNEAANASAAAAAAAAAAADPARP